MGVPDGGSKAEGQSNGRAPRALLFFGVLVHRLVRCDPLLPGAHAHARPNQKKERDNGGKKKNKWGDDVVDRALACFF